MAKLIAVYGQPTDKEAFNTYYEKTHIPLAKKVPGLMKYDISHGPVVNPGGQSNFYLVATLYFDSMESMQAGLNAPEGQAAAEDTANFATGGVQMYMFETQEV